MGSIVPGGAKNQREYIAELKKIKINTGCDMTPRRSSLGLREPIQSFQKSLASEISSEWFLIWYPPARTQRGRTLSRQELKDAREDYRRQMLMISG
jgi:hypothetical protein